ncbi:MAG: hypothetical protein ACYCO9_16985 [Streptosporangiaceae bacterium]
MIRDVLPQGPLPQLGASLFLTDSGIETDLIEHGGFDLSEFAAFVLLDDERGGCCGTDARHVRAIAAACLPVRR